MSALRCIVATLLFVGLGIGLPVTANADDALLKEVNALGDKLAVAMVAGDAATMLAMYTEDAISLPNYEGRLDGVEAIKKSHEAAVAAGMKIHSFESEATNVWQAGDQIVEIGKFTISLTPPGFPSAVEDKGKYMTIYVRDAEGNLKVKAETWNSDLNPMAQMGGGMEGQGHQHGS